MVKCYQLLASTLAMILWIPVNIGNALGSRGETKILCIGSEREALLEFKQGLFNTSNPLSSWAPGTDCCKWKGVKCNKTTGHVISLDLGLPYDFCGYMGFEINSTLLGLPYLTYLDLSCNYLTWNQEPAVLGSLNNLQHLNLSHCSLEGTIPDDLRNLSSLKSLDLSHNYNLRANNLEWLFGLSSLKVVDLSWVDLSNTADSWMHAVNVLPSLAELRLEGCLLDYVPPLLPQVNCDSLLILDLSNNDFNTSAILDWVFQSCHNLHHLDLSVNELKGEIPALTYLSNDSLSGAMLGVNQLRKRSALRDLRLSHNHLNGTLKTLMQQLSQLTVLDVSHNELEGVITDVDLENFQSLQVLDLSENHFIFNITREWIPSFQLETIGLSRCNLGPQFPKWIHTQKNLFYIDISDNNISDTVPDWFWNLSPRAQYMNLSYNDLKGFVPDFSSEMILQTLDLSSNNFACPFPKFPQQIAELNLARNSFFGPILDICSMNTSSLKSLHLFSNKLSGSLPNCWTNVPDLVVLHLADNQFFGSIPDSLGTLTNLLVLSLNNNKLSGNLPLFMKSFSSLILFDLGNNKLSGPIPSWINGENMPSLDAIILSSNAFQGNIPKTLCSLENLKILDLSLNQLSGAIPPCIFVSGATEESHFNYTSAYIYSDGLYISIDYTEHLLLSWKRRYLSFSGEWVIELIRAIDFSSNFLTGEIPEEVTTYVSLKSMNLSRNQLEGAIPFSIGNMESLEALDLSRNKLSGIIPTSMTDIDQLSILDVSHNNLTGPIPLGRHFDTFDASSFTDNPNLCGPPLNKSCSTTNGSFQDPYDPKKGGGKRGFRICSFYISMAIGFVTGFWAIWGPLLVSRSWNQAYFRFLGRMYDKIYVMVAITMARLRRKLQG